MSQHCLLIPLLLAVFTANASAGEYQCQEPPQVFIAATEDRDVAGICTAAAKAFNFLAQFKLTAQRPIHILLLEGPIALANGKVHGSYNRDSDIILLTSFEAIVKQRGMSELYPGIFDEIHYSGLIAHEVAHAVIQHNLVSGEQTIAQEYLAYSTQLGVMPEERRARIIAAVEGTAWEKGHVISAGYLALAPEKFAVKSYLHLVAQKNPRQFVESLLKTEGATIYVH